MNSLKHRQRDKIPFSFWRNFHHKLIHQLRWLCHDVFENVTCQHHFFQFVGREIRKNLNQNFVGEVFDAVSSRCPWNCFCFIFKRLRKINFFHELLFQNISRRQLTHHVLVAQLNVCPKFYQFDGKTDFDSTEAFSPRHQLQSQRLNCKVNLFSLHFRDLTSRKPQKSISFAFVSCLV